MGKLSTWVWGALQKRGPPVLSFRVCFQKVLGLPSGSGAASVVPYVGTIMQSEGF